MRRLGATPEDIAQAQAQLAAQDRAQAQDDAAFGVWDENWDTFLFFIALKTQWQMESLTVTMHGPMGSSSSRTELVRAGLPADRVESRLRLKGIRRALWTAMSEDIERMELAVLQEDQRLRNAAAARR